MRLAPFLALFLIFSLGCQGGEKTASASTNTSAPEPASLYEQVRSGSFQLGQAQDAIAEAYQASLELPASLGEARAEIQDILDGTGESLSKYSPEPAPKEEFEANQEAEAKRRLEAIDAANDTIRDLAEAKDIIAALVEDNKDATKQQLEKLDALVDVAVEAIVSAIEAYGGQVAESPAGEGDETPQ